MPGEQAPPHPPPADVGDRGENGWRPSRAEDPSAVALDTRSVRAANHVPAATTGKDAAKRVPGRKRGLAVDVLGLIIAVVVMAASATDNQIGVQLIDRVVAHTPTVSKAWVDAGFKDEVAIHGAVHGIDVEQVLRSERRGGSCRSPSGGSSSR